MHLSFIRHRKALSSLLVVAFAAVCTGAESQAPLAGKAVEDLSYMYGWEAAGSPASQGLRPLITAYSKGVADGLSGRSPRLTEAEVQGAQVAHEAKIEERLREFSQYLKTTGEAFRAEFALKDGVKETTEGLLYRYIDEGSGDLPGDAKTIRVAFHTYIPGFGVVDLAPRHPQPLNLLIASAPLEGMMLAARLLREGSKMECVLSPALAFGENGRDGFPPNATVLITIQREAPDQRQDKFGFENPYKALPTRPARVIEMGEDISYLAGFKDAKRLYSPALTIEESHFLAGFTDAVSGKTPAIDAASAQSALQAERDWVAARRIAIAKQTGPRAALFMKQTAARADVHSTPSGLAYRVLRKGDGPIAAPDTFVKIHCEVRLFDQDEPIELWPVTQPMNVLIADGLLPGLLEGLRIMPIGSEYEFFVPSDLAFGAEGAASVPPGSALVLKVNLLSVVD